MVQNPKKFDQSDLLLPEIFSHLSVVFLHLFNHRQQFPISLENKVRG